jgi:hypothetical protein
MAASRASSRPASRPGLSDDADPSQPEEAIVPKNLSDEAIQSFDAEVKEANQGEIMLGGTVRVKSNVVGESHRFPKLGKGMARKRTNPYSKLVPMGLQYSHVTATLEEYHATEWSSIWDNQVVPWDDRSMLANAIRKAIERRKDQLIVDALDAAATPQTVGINIGGTNSGLNVDKLRRTARLLDDKEAPTDGRTFLGSTIGKEQLLGQTAVTSADFNSVRALVNGEISTFMGFAYRWMAARDEGGLPLAANQRTNFAYVKPGMGLADAGLDTLVNVDWIPENAAWLNDQGFKAGAVGIDTDDIVEITSYES